LQELTWYPLLLDHDGEVWICGARSDVTIGCGKSGADGYLADSVRLRQPKILNRWARWEGPQRAPS